MELIGTSDDADTVILVASHRIPHGTITTSTFGDPYRTHLR